MTSPRKRALAAWVLAELAGAFTAAPASADPEAAASATAESEAGDEPEAEEVDETPDSPAPPEQSARPEPAKSKHHRKAKATKGRKAQESEPSRGGLLALLPGGRTRDLGKLEVHGRVFARAAFSQHYVTTTARTGAVTEERVDAFDLSVPSARAELYYRAPIRWLSADLEVEFADKPELKDAWLRAKTTHFLAKIGQFKTPFSALELESRFTLPTADRGTIHDILVDELEVAGRRPALVLAARTRGPLELSLTLGAAQGSVLVDRDGNERDVELLSEQSVHAQSWFARSELAFDDVTFGIGYEHRVGTPDVYAIEHYPTFGADAVLDTKVLGRGLRVWLEGMAGASWFEHSRKPSDGRNAVFSAGRLIIAPRFGGNEKHAAYLEPYGRLGLFDPDTEVAEDLVFEENLGINVGFWRLARLGLELQIAEFQRNFPISYGLGKNPDRVAVVLQAGLEF